ncbi:MAG: class I SAM-dependent methyltransferase [Anaerolineales bacterium]|nr:class I SAM-dependent methyltransferase [Anaerolineales bacterium]
MSISRNDIVTINQKGWNIVAPQFYGGTALPKYGPLSVTESELQLIENLKGKSVLELGCGSGHTLYYLWKEKQAGELWGLDLSQEQIQYTQDYLAKENIQAKLFLASMDENPGIPESYFDMVVSIYSLGWTPDLPRTLSLVYSYLKPGGKFVFSWEHPVYQCLDYDADLEKYVMNRSYLDESPEFNSTWKGTEIVIQPRKLSTYINAISNSGLIIEHMVESEVDMKLARPQDYAPEKWYSVPRAKLIPTTFIVKAFKPS